MHPLYFNNVSDSPVIVLSPHQHQFDSITKAAHSLYRSTSKPAMDRRPHDHPLTSSSHAAKRSRDDVDRVPPQPVPSQPTPADSPEISPHSNPPIVQQSSQTPANVEGQPEEEELQKKRLRLASPPDNGTSTNPDGSTPNPSSCESAPGMVAFIWSERLGVGWKSRRDCGSVETTLRSYVKILENQGALTKVSIRAVKGELSAFMVDSAQGWYLFEGDLQRNHRLAQDLDEAIDVARALQSSVEQTIADFAETTAPTGQPQQVSSIMEAIATDEGWVSDKSGGSDKSKGSNQSDKTEHGLDIERDMEMEDA